MLDRTGTSRQSDATRADGKPASGLPRLAMLAPFGTRSFRFQWPADLLTSWAFEMETIILGWYVLVQTGSVFWLTVFGASQYLGTLIAPMYGVAGDRLGHKSLLLGMRAIYGVCASSLLTFILLGWISPAVVLAVTTVMGLVRPSDLGVRGALIAEIDAGEHAGRRAQHLAHHAGLRARRRLARRRQHRGLFRHGACLRAHRGVLHHRARC